MTGFGDTVEIMKKDWFAETLETEFEGFYFNIPKKYNEILKLKYENYMQLPPLEDQVPQHRFEAWII